MWLMVFPVVIAVLHAIVAELPVVIEPEWFHCFSVTRNRGLALSSHPGLWLHGYPVYSICSHEDAGRKVDLRRSLENVTITRCVYGGSAD